MKPSPRNYYIMSFRVLALFATSLIFDLGLLVADEAKQNTDSADKNYRAELPRIPAKTPAEALRAFKLLPGFRVELVAAEPLVRDPVSISFDENGRAYVTELPRYNQYEFKGFGTVKFLEDTNGDGRFDKSSVFLDDVKYPTSVFAYGGGAFVADPPDVFFCEDTDGDGRADVKKVVMTGFGLDHAGEAGLNSFRWGMDNRIHMSLSLAAGKVQSTTGPKSKPVEVRGRGMVFDPRTGTFELTTGAGQHGMTLDDWGRKFVCSNSNPMQTLMYDGRYVARNPYLAPPGAAVTIAPGGKFTKIHRISTIEPWRIVRTRLRSQGLIKGSDEGGKPGGFFTAATGITAYRGDAWPRSYRGNLLVGEVSNNLIYRARLEPNGLGVIGRRADQGAEFLASSDNWFRPVQLANAPDGSLYVLDMYRELIEGAAFIAPAILKHLDVSSGDDRGRIYRIVPTSFQQPKLPKLGDATTAQLVATLSSENGWRRDTAARLLYERQDKTAVADLKQLVADSPTAVTRAQAMHTLRGLDSLGDDMIVQGLHDTDPRVRIQALRLAEQVAAHSAAVRTKMYSLVGDDDLNVRYQLAFSLGAFSSPRRNEALAEILIKEGSDQWIRLAVQTSLGSGAGDVFSRLAAAKAFRQSPHGKLFLEQLAAQIGTAGRQNEIAQLLTGLRSVPEQENKLAQSIVRGLLANASQAVRKSLSGAKNGQVEQLLRKLLADSRNTATNSKAKPAARTEAIQTLGLSDFGSEEELFAELLESRQPPQVQLAALSTLGRFDEPAVAELLLEAWPRLSPKVRSRAAEALFSRPAWIRLLLDAVEAEDIRPTDIDPARIALLNSHADKIIQKRAKSLFVGQALSKRQDVVKEYQAALTLAGDALRGKDVFKKTCSTCHRLEGVGTALGADLKAVKDRGNEAVVLNILDPNREVKPQFVGYVLLTDKGLTVTGLITEESANSVTLKRADGSSDTVLRVNIDELRSTGISFMPEGLEKDINKQQMADLLAYLNSIK